MYNDEHNVAIIRVVVNATYGGFSLSREAEYELARHKNWEVETYDDGRWLRLKGDESCRPLHDLIPRHDPHLVRIVEEMGEKSWGPSARLAIRNMRFGYTIDTHNGRENIHAFGTPPPYHERK